MANTTLNVSPCQALLSLRAAFRKAWVWPGSRSEEYTSEGRVSSMSTGVRQCECSRELHRSR